VCFVREHRSLPRPLLCRIIYSIRELCCCRGMVPVDPAARDGRHPAQSTPSRAPSLLPGLRKAWPGHEGWSARLRVFCSGSMYGMGRDKRLGIRYLMILRYVGYEDIWWMIYGVCAKGDNRDTCIRYTVALCVGYLSIGTLGTYVDM